MEFLSGKGYWVFYPRYRGAWESGGSFLKKSPHLDILDVVDALSRSRSICEVTYGQKFAIKPDDFFIIGGSFGGAASLLASLDPRIKKVIANCPVVDWSILRNAEKAETSNKSYPAYVREAFGSGYRLTDKNWKKLSTGTFYSPIAHIQQIDPLKVLMFHAKDDPVVPWRSVDRFAKKSGVKLKLLARGGHLRTDVIVQKYWPQIEKFFRA